MGYLLRKGKLLLLGACLFVLAAYLKLNHFWHYQYVIVAAVVASSVGILLFLISLVQKNKP